MRQSLNGVWKLSKLNDKNRIDADVPGSVYSALLKNGLINNPYYRDNEKSARLISDDSYVFERRFAPALGVWSQKKRYLVFEGIDTAAFIYLNGTPIGETDNMHRTYEFDVTGLINEVKNILTVVIMSPARYISERNAARPLWGDPHAEAGFSHMRKAHYMFGCDSAPAVPDMGIFRDVGLLGVSGGRISSVYVRQTHALDCVKLSFEAELSDVCSDSLTAEVILRAPDGAEIRLMNAVSGSEAVITHTVTRPYLWNVRGYGGQPLYAISFSLYDGGGLVDAREFSIGLRRIETSDGPYGGGTPVFKVNGMKVFAMGAGYVPEDLILSGCGEERTKSLMLACEAANFNMIRVWGGGFYPEDYFYDMCDRLGILICQDFMFARAVYPHDERFLENAANEVKDNIKRIRNHPCLAAWRGGAGAVMEEQGLSLSEELQNGYVSMFETLFTSIAGRLDPQTPYLPPVYVLENKEHDFSFCSESGMESIPEMKTVMAFAEEGDLNLMSRVMSAHHKCNGGAEKTLYFIAQAAHYPYSFEDLSYVSQLVQAEGVKEDILKMRRAKDVFAGAFYWQLNDSFPGISRSSLDYFGRWKALHYYAKRFFAPVVCSVDASDKNNLAFYVTNDTLYHFAGKIKWRIRRADNKITAYGECDVSVAPRSAEKCFSLNASGINADMHKNHVVEYLLIKDSAIISSAAYMFVQPKSFEFSDPKITFSVDRMADTYRIALSSENFAKGVRLSFEDSDCVFSDNWFDLFGKAQILLRSPQFENLQPEAVAKALKVKSYYDIIKSG